jgi:polyisoprenyl-phosphate glycosyltransferase
MKRLAIIVPCFQNEGSIIPLCAELLSLRDRLRESAVVSFVFVNDGSTDLTLERLLEFRERHPQGVKVIDLTRNFGSYNAFLAGMEHVEADCHVHLHADLQDPPQLIDEMFRYWTEGERLVIAYRDSREDGSPFSSLYHFLVRKLAIRNVPSGGYDLILFDERIRREVVSILEKNTNIVYLISWLGYPYKAIPYKRKKREFGISQWRFAKKMRLFFDMFFSFTDLPHLAVKAVATSFLLLAIGIGAIAAVIHANEPLSFSAWMLVVIIVMLAQLAVVAAIICEYLVRIHEIARKRPNTVESHVYE